MRALSREPILADSIPRNASRRPLRSLSLIHILFVFFMCATKKDFGPMRVAEAEVQKPADQQHRIPSKDSALESMSTVGISDPNAADALPAKLDTCLLYTSRCV